MAITSAFQADDASSILAIRSVDITLMGVFNYIAHGRFPKLIVVFRASKRD